MKTKLHLLVFCLLGVVLLALGWTGRRFYQQDPYLGFLTEVYAKIQENYWEKIPDEQLVNLFQLGVEKLIGQPQDLKKKDKASLEKMLKGVLGQIPEPEKKKEFSALLADIVLANLQPTGRSRLYTQKEEKALSENVQNISGADQYQILEVPKEASSQAMAKAYEQKVAELQPQAESSEETRQELEKVKQAYKVLGDEASRKIYDQAGVEPTMDYALIRPDILHLHLKKMSPTSLDELKRVTEKFDKEGGPTSLILDLRDNIGGSIDLLPYFLGPFIGQDQYAYQFYHQGEKIDFKTHREAGWMPSLVRYKKVVILINQGTQSSAETVAATLKKYNVGILVGVPTKGWGTVEKVFPVNQQLDPNEKYSIFLVHSLVLGEDSQPIEGRGVEPLVNISQPNWEKELLAYFNYPELIQVIKNLIN